MFKQLILPIDKKIQEVRMELANARVEINSILSKKITELMSITCQNLEDMPVIYQMSFSLKGQNLRDEIAGLIKFLGDGVDQGNINIFNRTRDMFDAKLPLISEEAQIRITLVELKFAGVVAKEMMEEVCDEEKKDIKLSGVDPQAEADAIFT